MATKIPWCDETLNLVTGCTKVSPGCKFCYAEGLIARFGHRRDGSVDDKKFNRIVLHPDRLKTPHKWKKPKSIFVCSMGDLFHESIPAFFIQDFITMSMKLPRHTFLVLTKRPEKVIRYVNYFDEILPLNVWLGVSVEDQKTADERIPELLKSSAAKHFVSVEPMLGPVNLNEYLDRDHNTADSGRNLLDWVVCGCESGNRRRETKLDWISSLKHQCGISKTPFFLKQMDVGGKLVEMPMLNGKIWNQKP